MERKIFEPRPDFEKRNSEMGFDFGNLDASNYWNETVGYKFSAGEVDRLEEATNELFKISMETVEKLIYAKDYHARLRLSPEVVKLVQRSWEEDEYSLYGRFDLSYDGKNIKCLEYNADTPTSLLESALVQYYWMKDRNLPDQFNSIHEKLIDCWKYIKKEEIGSLATYFTCLRGNQEDYRTVEYLMDTASQAGLRTQFIFLNDIGTDGSYFYDLGQKQIKAAFKLYPWEWLVEEEFGPTLTKAPTGWVEPAWKMLMSSKAFMVELWKYNKRHPLLLQAAYENEGAEFTAGAVRKPAWSREGSNITLPGQTETAGDYSGDGYIMQEYAPLPAFDGWHPMVGSWVIGDEAAGIGIREDKSLVTGNMSRFTPHWFE